jgi:UMF1 family MFS transporter
MPLTGALADQLGRRKPFLVAFTVLACAASVVLGLVPVGESVVPALVIAGVAAAAAQLAFAQYDPLLADVAPEGTRGRVSGTAVALGFAGIVFGLVVVAELIVGEGSKQRAFAPAGLLYLLFALPALLLVREPARPHGRLRAGVAVRRAVEQVGSSLRQARRYPDVYRFLAARFLYSDAVVTLSAFLAVYMTRLGGFSEREKNIVVGVAVVAAAGGALAGGRMVERLGAKRPLVLVLPAFGASVLLSALIGRPWTIWVVGPVAGAALGVIWTADRVLMLRLTPPELRGQFFGFFNLANRVASAVGPLVIWSGTVWLLAQETGWTSELKASRVAVGGLGLAALAGWLVIRPLPDGGLERAKSVPVGT